MPKRRRGARSAPLVRRASRHVGFEQLVPGAVAAIPSPFREALAEVAIVIDDEPTDRQRADNDLADGDDLYRLYEGVPRTEHGAGWMAIPNRVTLFRLALEEDFPAPRERAEEVRVTVIDELAHPLG